MQEPGLDGFAPRYGPDERRETNQPDLASAHQSAQPVGHGQPEILQGLPRRGGSCLVSHQRQQGGGAHGTREDGAKRRLRNGIHDYMMDMNKRCMTK